MAYLGRGIENLSDRVVLDSLTASATASYTLQLNSVNFVPSSAESLTVSLNGVIQAPISSYTVSGSTLTFASALTSSDSIDFIIAERGITLQTPSAGSVGTSQLASSAVTNAKIASDAAIATTKLGTGAVLQAVSTKTNAQVTVSTVSVETHVHQSSITPTSTSSKILVLANINGIASGAANANRVQFRVRWDTSSGGTSGTEVAGSHSATNGTAVQEITSSSLAALVSPSSTSQLYFKVTVYTHDTGNTRYVNIYSSDTAVTLLEIAG